MSDMLQNMTHAFSGYIGAAEPDGLPFWLFIFGPAFAIWIISIIVLSLRKEGFLSEGKKGILRRQFRVWESVFGVGLVSMAILTGTGTILWIRGFYTDTPYQLAHLLGVALCGIVSLVAFLRLRNATSRQESSNFIKQPVTRNEEQLFLHSAGRSFNQLKLTLLLPFLGFLPLAFKSSPPNLVSLVFDVSTSMESPSLNGEIPLEIGRVALHRTVSELSPNTDIVISIFEEQGIGGRAYKNSILDILQARQSSDLTGIHQHFRGAERSSALSYVRTLGSVLTESTPMYETIWSNFLYQREVTAGKTYANKVAVYITDGFDQLDDQPTGFLCENTEYSTFYSQENPVHLVNLSEGIPTNLGAKIEDCGYQAWDGFDSGQFNEVLNNILKRFKEDWAFVLWLVTLCVAIALAGVVVFPKSR